MVGAARLKGQLLQQLQLAATRRSPVHKLPAPFLLTWTMWKLAQLPLIQRRLRVLASISYRLDRAVCQGQTEQQHGLDMEICCKLTERRAESRQRKQVFAGVQCGHASMYM